jgi:hypothetical protein
MKECSNCEGSGLVQGDESGMEVPAQHLDRRRYPGADTPSTDPYDCPVCHGVGMREFDRSAP